MVHYKNLVFFFHIQVYREGHLDDLLDVKVVNHHGNRRHLTVTSKPLFDIYQISAIVENKDSVRPVIEKLKCKNVFSSVTSLNFAKGLHNWTISTGVCCWSTTPFPTSPVETTQPVTVSPGVMTTNTSQHEEPQCELH